MIGGLDAFLQSWNSPFGCVSDCDSAANIQYPLPYHGRWIGVFNLTVLHPTVILGSGLDAPLYALQMLMGSKRNLVTYLPLNCSINVIWPPVPLHESSVLFCSASGRTASGMLVLGDSWRLTTKSPCSFLAAWEIKSNHFFVVKKKCELI